ncbi:hypothetical protein LAZ67_20001485 [Cordylochernes scorpioides]|uniref:Transposase n=1 Tax=Cordylochernes scorpioides TaxID=51811 RepID=A0ABY6LMX1_9ARAC|nr:hypothetical protein LAZ67_20001485 [Cordylochernes scorpioides]
MEKRQKYSDIDVSFPTARVTTVNKQASEAPAANKGPEHGLVCYRPKNIHVDIQTRASKRFDKPESKSKRADRPESKSKRVDRLESKMIALDGLSFSVFVTSKDLRKCLNALGHEIPLFAETIKIKVCRYADTFREKVVRELQMEKEKGQLFSLTLDEWTSIRSKRYLNINIHSRTKVWNLGLTRISGVFSSEQCKYVICA